MLKPQYSNKASSRNPFSLTSPPYNETISDNYIGSADLVTNTITSNQLQGTGPYDQGQHRGMMLIRESANISRVRGEESPESTLVSERSHLQFWDIQSKQERKNNSRSLMMKK